MGSRINLISDQDVDEKKQKTLPANAPQGSTIPLRKKYICGHSA